MTRPLVGAILAAGQGSRIQPLSADTPKPLLPLLHQPIIGYQIQRMRALGIEEVYVVVGYFGNRLMQELGDGSRWGVELHYVEQTTRDGIGHAVSLLEPMIGDRSFVLFLGDIFFELDRIERLRDALDDDSADSVLAVTRESDAAVLRRNFEVLLSDDGTVREVREKPRVVEGDIKGCGLYLFSGEIFESIRNTPRSALRGEIELTDAIQVHIDRGFRVVAAEVVERDWNISIPRDLLELNMHLLDENGVNACVADSVSLPGDVTIVKSVLLDGARVEPGTRLERCLVLAGASVSSGRWKDTIFFEGGALAFE